MGESLTHPRGPAKPSGGQLALLLASIILYILTIGALLWFGWRQVLLKGYLVSHIHDAIETEVRRQDDRLEKRVQRAAGPRGDTDETEPGLIEILPGRPLRRQ